jgi:hypothetical protein
MRPVVNQMRDRIRIPAMAVAMLTLAFGSGGAFANEEAIVSQFFDNYCVRCHGPEKQKGDVRLDRLDYAIKDHAALPVWQDVLDVLNTGDMPPGKEKQPKPDELTSVIGAITGKITAAHKRLAATGGVISMRHLTKREYLGSMRDLFGDDLPQDLLPDEVSAEFDTIGSDQFFSLKQYESFYKSGKEVIRRNLRTLTSPLPKPGTVRHDPEVAPNETARTAYETMVKTKELIEAGAPIAEISRINPKVGDAGQARLFIKRYPIRSKKPTNAYQTSVGRKGMPGGFEYETDARPRSAYTLNVTALNTSGGDVAISVNGRRVGSVQFEPGESRSSSRLTFVTGLFDERISIGVRGTKKDVFDFLTLSGPFEDNQTAPSFFDSVVGPAIQGVNATDSEIAAMLRRFADRAFRYQGVDDAYIAELVKVYRLERTTGKSAVESLIEPLAAIVTAPAFLYVKEKNDGARTVLSQKEFAIRMAYFLWGAPPDRELYDLAKAKRLYDRDVMRAQFERMLASGKADAFLTGFINQWSDISRFDEIDLPVKLIRNGFQASARREIGEFFKVLVRENKPVDHLIDSDFVVVDEKLADYYGLNASIEGGFQKVALPASNPRGGMLSQAAFLIIGGSGPRTSPTIRGTILREKFLHDPPPPPPPNVPAIETAKKAKLTVKQLVDRHMSIPQCASCHNKIDPIGYGLENFDYLGNWRKTETLGGEVKKRRKSKRAKSEPQKVDIDASGHVNGKPFKSFTGLKQALSENKDSLARSVYESLLAYGIGRRIEFVDDEDVNDRLTALKSRNYPLQDMIFEIVASKTFAAK